MLLNPSFNNFIYPFCVIQNSLAKQQHQINGKKQSEILDMLKVTVGLLFLITITLSNSQAQTTLAEKTDCTYFFDTLCNMTVYKTATRFATVEGGEEALLTTIYKNIKYPIIKWETIPIQSKIVVAFVVDTSGIISGKRIIKNIEGTDLAQQVLALVDNLKWIPASCNNIAIPTLYHLPVQIELK